MSAVISPTSTIEPVITGEQHIILRHSSWVTYQRLLDEREGSRPRFAYHRGVLEIMTNSLQHERLVRLFEALINALALAFNRDVECAGEVTCQRADLQSGFEPDGSYYISNITAIRAQDRLDLNFDPAPDLVVEVDLSRSSLDKQPIMAALGIKEIWRFQKGTVSILRLIDNSYQSAHTSECFPKLTGERLNAWIAAGQNSPRSDWLRQVVSEATQLL